MTIKLTVRMAPTVDRDKLIIRINSNAKPNSINWYDYVEFKNMGNGKTVVCKLSGDDIPEIGAKDRQSSLVRINEPLRGKLGVKVGDSVEFKIKKKLRWGAWYYFIRYHPDDVIKVTTWLGIIAVVLGLVSILVAVFSS
jgi:hypothetical protein